MQKRQIVLWFLVPSNQQPAKAVHPRMRPLRHLAPRFKPGFPLDGLGLYSTRANVSGEPEFLQNLPYFVIRVLFCIRKPGESEEFLAAETQL